MSDIDAALEKLALAKGGREYALTRTLIAALLRARKKASKIHTYAVLRQTTSQHAKDREVWRDIERMTRPLDTELAEALP